jgi:hypothetical protein
MWRPNMMWMERDMRVGPIGPYLSVSLMYGLSWVLLCVSVMMVILAILGVLDLLALPIAVRTDLIGAAACSALALVFRSLARKFDDAIQQK